MFDPNWHFVVLLVAAWLFGYLWAWAFARHRQMVSNARWREQLHQQQVSLAAWLIHLFGTHHGLNQQYAAKTAANLNAGLGAGLAESFDLAWNPQEDRWYVPRPRQPKDAEPQVDLREEEPDAHSE